MLCQDNHFRRQLKHVLSRSFLQKYNSSGWCSSFEKFAKKDKEENKWQTCLSGMLLSLGNPKPILFYASVLPAIINFNEVRLIDALMMMALIALVSFSVVGTYSYIASSSHKIQMGGKMQIRTNQAAGFVMATVGIFVMIH